MERTQLLEHLNALLEAERAGAKGLGAMAQETESHAIQTALRDVARDEARFCAMLAGHIERLGGTPSRKTGRFAEKLMAAPTIDDRLALLDRGQEWVARRLREMLPALSDAELLADLSEMLDVHERNIARCAALGGSAG